MSILYSRINIRSATFYGIYVISTAIILFCAVPLFGGNGEKTELRQGNFQTEEQAKQELARFAQTYSNLEQWKVRAAGIREGILRGAQLLPLPKKCPLNPIIHSKRQYDGYTVENAAFESLPGVFVTGNLYRPLQGKAPFPAVLCTHGHGPQGRFSPDHQKRCATLARMGAVVF